MTARRVQGALAAVAAGLWLGAALPAAAQTAAAVEVGGTRAGEAYEALGDFLSADSPSRDRARAIDAYRKAIDAGNRQAVTKLAKLLLAGTAAEDVAEAEALLRAAAASGNVAAGDALGDIYRTDPRLRDPVKARAAYEAAAAAGDAGVTLKLARLLASGDGVPEDRPRAIALYRGLVDGADPAVAAHELAQLYAAGIGYADKVKARPYYEIAAAGGIGEAHLALAEMDGERYHDPAARRSMIDHFIAAAGLLGIDTAVVRMASLPQPVLVSIVRDLLVQRGLAIVPLSGRSGERDIVASFCRRQRDYYCSEDVLPPEMLVQLIAGPGAAAAR